MAIRANRGSPNSPCHGFSVDAAAEVGKDARVTLSAGFRYVNSCNGRLRVPYADNGMGVVTIRAHSSGFTGIHRPGMDAPQIDLYRTHNGNAEFPLQISIAMATATGLGLVCFVHRRGNAFMGRNAMNITVAGLAAGRCIVSLRPDCSMDAQPDGGYFNGMTGRTVLQGLLFRVGIALEIDVTDRASERAVATLCKLLRVDLTGMAGVARLDILRPNLGDQ